MDGFEIGISTIKATKNGENSDQIMFNDPEVAYIVLIPTNLQETIKRLSF